VAPDRRPVERATVMRTLIYPGTFDPFTKGHVDIARRAARLCDHLIIAILTNSSKKPAFSAEERVRMAQLSLQDLAATTNITVESFDGLLVDLFRARGASAVVRGLRSESDFRFEAEIAAANQLMLPEYETCLLPCRIDLAFTSSSIVREVASYGGDISGMVPAAILTMVQKQLGKHKVNDLQPD
jgi:pantetheine-phosphate adenylyltransferase